MRQLVSESVLLAAIGGCMVTFFKPNPPQKKKAAVTVTAPAIAAVTIDTSEYEIGRRD